MAEGVKGAGVGAITDQKGSLKEHLLRADRQGDARRAIRLFGEGKGSGSQASGESMDFLDSKYSTRSALIHSLRRDAPPLSNRHLHDAPQDARDAGGPATLNSLFINNYTPPYGHFWEDVTPFDRSRIASVLFKDGMHGREINHDLRFDRLRLYTLTYATMWHRSMVSFAAIMMALAFFEEPCESLCVNPTILAIVEAICISALSLDALFRFISRGRESFLRSGWHKVLVVMLLFSWVWMFVPHRLRIQRMIRPFYLGFHSHSLRKIINSMFKGVISIAYVGTVLIFHLVVFGIVGTKFFKHVSPREFGNFYKSVISLFTLLTTANYPDVMVLALRDSRWNFLFFFCFLVIGLFLFLNLVLAMVFNSYKSAVEKNLKVYRSRARLALQASFELLDLNNQNYISLDTFRHLMLHLKPELKPAEVEALFRVADVSDDGLITRKDFPVLVILYNANFHPSQPEHKPPTRWERMVLSIKERTVTVKRWNTFIESIRYVLKYPWPGSGVSIMETLIDLTVVLNLVFLILIDVFKQHSKGPVYLFINILLCLHVGEMTAQMIVQGASEFLKDKMNMADFVILVVAIVEWIVNGNGGDAAALRSIRLLRLLKHNEHAILLYRAMNRAASVLLALFVVLIMILYVFAVVGMDLLQDKLDEGHVPSHLEYHTHNYYGMNYDSLGNAFIVQFALLVVNNWYIFADAACAVSDESMRIFFIAFYVIGVLVALNVITAFVLDTVTFVQDHPNRQGKYQRLIGNVERILNEYAGLPGYQLKLNLHRSMDLVLGEIFEDEGWEKVDHPGDDFGEPKDETQPPLTTQRGAQRGDALGRVGEGQEDQKHGPGQGHGQSQGQGQGQGQGHGQGQGQGQERLHTGIQGAAAILHRQGQVLRGQEQAPGLEGRNQLHGQDSYWHGQEDIGQFPGMLDSKHGLLPNVKSSSASAVRSRARNRTMVLKLAKLHRGSLAET